MSKIKIEKKYKVCDKTGKVLANDIKKDFRCAIHNHKLEKPFLTFDNKHFINFDSDSFVITENDSDDEIVAFDISNFEKYNVVTLSELNYVIEITDEAFNNEIKKYDIMVDDALNKDDYRIIDLGINNNFSKKCVYEVLDKNGNILVRDAINKTAENIHNFKLKKPFISFDGHTYINTLRDRLIITEIDIIDGELIPFDIKNFKGYSISTFKALEKIEIFEDYEKEINKYDVIVDNDISSLDSEVKDLVYALNNCIYDIKTTGSCSGHNIAPLWVTIEFTNIKQILYLLEVIYKDFQNEFILTSDKIYYAYNYDFAKLTNLDLIQDNRLVLKLSTISKGEEAYKLAKLLAEVLLRDKEKYDSNKGK